MSKKWKNIGSVHSGDDNKSNRSVRSRSRDEMPSQSFHQNIARMKMSNSQLVDSQNTYFCKNYIEKKKQTSSNKSLSRIKTDKSLTEERPDIMRSTISKKKISKDEDNQSKASSGDNKLQKTDQPKKLKKFAKQSQLKELKEDHYRLREFVKYEINSFTTAFKQLSEELKYEVNFKKELQAQKVKVQAKQNPLVPIVPFRFDSKILDSINFYDSTPKKQNSKPSQQADINVLTQIKTEARLCIEGINQFEDEKTALLERFKDINLQQLLA